MESRILKGQSRAIEQIHDRRRDEDLAGFGDGHDACRGVDRYATDVTCDLLDLSGMNASADRQAEAVGCVADGSRGPNGALSPVELGENAIAGGLDQASPMAIDGGGHLAIVVANKVTPARGAKLLCSAGRIDDIGEHDGGQGALVLGVMLLAIGAHRLEVDRDPWFITDHPSVVSGWNFEDVARADLELGAVRHLDAQATREREPQMMVLTCISARDWPDIH